MFEGTCFYIHDSVLSADDVAAQLQKYGGRLCLSYKRADVVLVDGARRASVAPLVAQQAEIVDSSWVAKCLKHGRRLPYTYQAFAREPEARLTSIDAEETTQRPSPSHRPETIPLPDIDVVCFNAPGGARDRPSLAQTPAVKNYFVKFMIAMWTMDSGRGIMTLTKDISKILPGLSEWSLHTFAKNNRKQVEYAKAEAACARNNAQSKRTKEFIDNEILKTAKTLATIYPSRYTNANGSGKISAKAKIATRCNKSRAAQDYRATPLGSRRQKQRRATIAISSPASKETTSYVRIGDSSVESLLATPGLPELPTSISSEARNAFCDKVLRWVLEREPNATQRSICDLVHAMGRRGNITFPERAFESSYRTEERKKRYKEIRESVWQQWCKGDLSNDARPPIECLGSKQKSNLKHGADRLPASQSEVAEVDASQNSYRTGHTRVSTASAAEAHPQVEIDAEDDEFMQNVEPGADDEPHAISSPPVTNQNTELNLKADVYLPAPKGCHEIVEVKRETRAPFTAANIHPGLQLRPEAIASICMSREELHTMALGHIWFEDFAAELNLTAGTDEYEAKRAPIWADMVQKFAHDEEHWKSLAELNQREVEAKVKQLRGRTTTFHYY